MMVRKMKSLGPTLFLLVAVLAPEPAIAQGHFPKSEDLELMLRHLVEDGEAPAIALGVLEADGSTRIVTFGSAGPDALPLSPRSVYEIGSITKTFTGTLLADMVGRGEVSLDDPVSKYLPPEVTVPSYDGREITLLDLATHTSGLPRLPTGFIPRDMQNPYAEWTVETLYSWLSGHELRREPGSEFEYSNLGFGLLGHALARAADTSLRNLMRERILDPLGMDMTGFALESEIEAWMVQGHSEGEVVPFWFATEAMDGAGGLRSNVEDMLGFLMANVGTPGSGLERAMRVAQEAQRPAGSDARNVGLGWQSYSLNGRPIVQHGGGTGGFGTLIAFDPVREVGVVVLANSTDFGSNLGTDLIVHEPPPSSPPVDVGLETLASYEGTYVSDRGGRMYVRLEEEGYLTIQPMLDARMRLHATSNSSFFPIREEWLITFQRVQGGDVTGLDFEWQGSVTRFDRTEEAVPPSKMVAGNARMSPEDIARYEGTYDLDLAGQAIEFQVFGTGTRLMSRLGQTTSRLHPLGAHQFVVEVNPGIRVVFTIEEDRAVSVTLHQGARSDSGDRRR